jgi:tRNA (guanosine-2'-O-)-methyltransferase
MGNDQSALISFLSGFVSESRLELMEQVLSQRTRHVTVVLEDLYQSQNASAVVRTCECLGIQDVHVVEDRSRYGTNKKVLKGSHHWVDIIKHRIRNNDDTSRDLEVGRVLKGLREKGYRILVTSVNPGSASIHDVDITKGPVALVMGNELRGTSEEMVNAADELVHIPMVGFTESFNVSVSAAICLSVFRRKMEAGGEEEVNWRLSPDEQQALRLKWLRGMVKKSAVLERRFEETRH